MQILNKPSPHLSSDAQPKRIQENLKMLLISESLKQMKIFPESDFLSGGVGQGSFESLLIDEYAKFMSQKMKFDLKVG